MFTKQTSTQSMKRNQSSETYKPTRSFRLDINFKILTILATKTADIKPPSSHIILRENVLKVFTRSFSTSLSHHKDVFKKKCQ